MIALVGIVAVIGAGMYLTRERPTDHINPNDLKTIPGAGSWADNEATPPIRHAPPPVAVAAPVLPQQVQTPITQHGPTCDESCQARRRLLAAAQGSGMSILVPGANTLELNQANAPLKAASTTPRCTRHCILANSWLYATLETGINSDHPGDVIARVSENVRDTVTQTEILIPYGSKLHGMVKPAQYVNLNNTSVNVDWDSLQLPNGAEIVLPHLPAADVAGYPGLHDKVDRHLTQTWGPAVLVSAITAGMMLAQNPTYGSYQGYSSTQQASGAFANTLGGQTNASLNMLLQQARPTITVAPGTALRVLITRDLPLDHPYEEHP
jgi:type IV secretory pathway VirB10-like protein